MAIAISAEECDLLEKLLIIDEVGDKIVKKYPEDIGERDDPLDHEYLDEIVSWYQVFEIATNNLREWRKNHMAVKVVSDKPVVSKRLVCANCGYELEYNNIDILYSGDNDFPPRLKCPREECNYYNNIREK